MTQNKLSRRDAIKILGATAGASALASLPSKWSKPELRGGILPAHAQTSVVYELTCGENGSLTVTFNTNPTLAQGNSSVTVGPVPPEVNVNYSVAIDQFNGTSQLNLPANANGSVLSSGGSVSLPIELQLLTYDNGNQGTWDGNVIITWSVGLISCSQTLYFLDILT